MLFAIQYFILLHDKQQLTIKRDVYSDVTTTLVIFNKTCIASEHLNQYEIKQL